MGKKKRNTSSMLGRDSSGRRACRFGGVCLQCADSSVLTLANVFGGDGLEQMVAQLSRSAATRSCCAGQAAVRSGQVGHTPFPSQCNSLQDVVRSVDCCLQSLFCLPINVHAVSEVGLLEVSRRLDRSAVGEKVDVRSVVLECLGAMQASTSMSECQKPQLRWLPTICFGH